jgi:hypothetical protein
MKGKDSEGSRFNFTSRGIFVENDLSLPATTAANAKFKLSIPETEMNPGFPSTPQFPGEFLSLSPTGEEGKSGERLTKGEFPFFGGWDEACCYLDMMASVREGLRTQKRREKREVRRVARDDGGF